MTDEAQELPRGSRLLDRYTIIDRVGGGGMATIHRAVDERFDRIVCVKLLRLELDGSGSTSGDVGSNPIYRLFLREALALSKLQHPNTLRIYDFGYLEDGQRPFQVSEFLDGGNLRQHVRATGALSPDETLAILERITGAIAEAHERKILHRDIKPSNILFSRVGGVLMPKLADFGIARTIRALKAKADEPDNMESFQGVGLFSPKWAAPEQLSGAPEGPYTDVYALGLVAAYMLGGVSPFEGAELLDVIDDSLRTDDMLRRRLVEMGISLDVVTVLMRAVAADPTQRTQTPIAFFEELQAAIGAPRSSLPGRPAATKPTKEAQRVAVPPLRAESSLGDRNVRVVEAHEKFDLDVKGAQGAEARFRVSILPEREGAFRIQIKGLNCFVSKVDAAGSARPTPAISAAGDGTVDFVSTDRRVLARVAYAFGRPAQGGNGHVFPIDGRTLVVPSLQGSFAVALDLGAEREIIVLCKRA